ncbi:Blp family class II bacteriocin [Streptococcus parasuis]|uniref:Blp family class II bacteriocin n=1 Tax=Streptococcus parasuis TaxID=1501662 RepID=UPI0024122A8A|nr:Blp family class II bacteriocin [Streptococcus parasuis]MDG4477396.1 Blp family class II bacteriocin [Streptococcus parasuis]
MNTKTFNTMNEEMLAQVEGGGCSVREADQRTFEAMVAGLVGGIPGGPGGMVTVSLLSGIGARVGYYLVCWT